MSEQLEQFSIGHFGFSAVQTDKLGAPEYTLVTLVCDRSGSTSGFQKQMEACVKEAVKACQISPRADFLLLRLLAFSTTVEEIHGFKLLENIGLDDYDGKLAPDAATILYDAAMDGLEATYHYGTELVKQEYRANAIVIFITDGRDTDSSHTCNDIKLLLEKIVASKDSKERSVESIMTILIGVNVQSQVVAKALTSFKDEAGLTQYVEVDNASAKTLAKIAQFISKSVSSQSGMIGSGGASQAIVF